METAVVAEARHRSPEMEVNGQTAVDPENDLSLENSSRPEKQQST